MIRETIDGIIESHQEAINKAAIEYIQEQARTILRDHKNLGEFIMCMGSWHFTLKTGEASPDYSYIEDSKLADFMADWDHDLRLTGIPMRFTETGEVVTEW